MGLNRRKEMLGWLNLAKILIEGQVSKWYRVWRRLRRSSKGIKLIN